MAASQPSVSQVPGVVEAGALALAVPPTRTQTGCPPVSPYSTVFLCQLWVFLVAESFHGSANLTVASLLPPKAARLRVAGAAGCCAHFVALGRLTGRTR